MALAIAEVTRVVASRSKTSEGMRHGQVLESLRRARGLTQAQLAEALGMSEEGYRNYAKGYLKITHDKLPRFSGPLGVPIPELADSLGINLVGDADASGLRQELAAILPDADATTLDDITHDLVKLPPSDRRQILQTWRDHLDGRLHRLGRA